VFPDEATDSNVIRVVMPEELRKVYDNLKKEADGSVEIPNPLFAYKFQEGVEEAFKATFKVSEESSLEGSRLQSFALLILVLIRARRIGSWLVNNNSISPSQGLDRTITHGPKEGFDW
jgi:hypothetical protein